MCEKDNYLIIKKIFIDDVAKIKNVFFFSSLKNRKQQHKISLIGEQIKRPSIVKTISNGIINPTNDKAERGKAFRQILAAFIANIGPMNTGLIFGFSACAIPQLTSPTSTIPVDANQASWIGEYFKKKILRT